MTEKPTYTLITGTSGFIGGAMLRQWHPQRAVLGLSRRASEVQAPQIQGDFASFEDLRQLDEFHIGALVHLGAVTGGCSEEDGLEVNVAGTRRLLRYLLDRGCRKFVLASSIAANGGLDNDFIPRELPMSDDHPCLARDAYGLSKHLMEELVHYFGRVQPDADWTLLRFGAVVDEANFTPSNSIVGDSVGIPFVLMAMVGCSDILRACELALDSPRAGVRTYNVVGPDCSSGDSPRGILEAQFGAKLQHIDWAHYEQPGHEHDALYAMDKIRKELGFVPKFTTR